MMLDPTHRCPFCGEPVAWGVHHCKELPANPALVFRIPDDAPPILGVILGPVPNLN